MIRREDAERSAVTLLHELFHEQYTGLEGVEQTCCTEWRTSSVQQEPQVAQVADICMQWLEDERVSKLGIRDYPELQEFLTRFGDLMLDRFDRAYEAEYGESPLDRQPRFGT